MNLVKRLVPNFVKKFVHHYRLQKKWGGENKIFTETIAFDAKLGRGIYLAKNVDVRNRVEIMDNSYCSSGTVLFNGTKIGKYCSIGYNVQIGCPEHPVSFLSTSPRIYRECKVSDFIHWPKDDCGNPVTIGNDVWVGSNAVILQGVTVGDGAVIAAGAVVTRNVDPFTIVGGVPAKVIRKRFNPETENLIKNSEWWNMNTNEIEQFAKNLYGRNVK